MGSHVELLLLHCSPTNRRTALPSSLNDLDEIRNRRWQPIEQNSVPPRIRYGALRRVVALRTAGPIGVRHGFRSVSIRAGPCCGLDVLSAR